MTTKRSARSSITSLKAAASPTSSDMVARLDAQRDEPEQRDAHCAAAARAKRELRAVPRTMARARRTRGFDARRAPRLDGGAKARREAHVGGVFRGVNTALVSESRGAARGALGVRRLLAIVAMYDFDFALVLVAWARLAELAPTAATVSAPTGRPSGGVAGEQHVPIPTRQPRPRRGETRCRRRPARAAVPLTGVATLPTRAPSSRRARRRAASKSSSMSSIVRATATGGRSTRQRSASAPCAPRRRSARPASGARAHRRGGPPSGGALRSRRRWRRWRARLLEQLDRAADLADARHAIDVPPFEALELAEEREQPAQPLRRVVEVAHAVVAARARSRAPRERRASSGELSRYAHTRPIAVRAEATRARARARLRR